MSTHAEDPGNNSRKFEEQFLGESGRYGSGGLDFRIEGHEAASGN